MNLHRSDHLWSFTSENPLLKSKSNLIDLLVSRFKEEDSVSLDESKKLCIIRLNETARIVNTLNFVTARFAPTKNVIQIM